MFELICIFFCEKRLSSVIGHLRLLFLLPLMLTSSEYAGIPDIIPPSFGSVRRPHSDPTAIGLWNKSLVKKTLVESGTLKLRQTGNSISYEHSSVASKKAQRSILLRVIPKQLVRSTNPRQVPNRFAEKLVLELLATTFPETLEQNACLFLSLS